MQLLYDVWIVGRISDIAALHNYDEAHNYFIQSTKMIIIIVDTARFSEANSQLGDYRHTTQLRWR